MERMMRTGNVSGCWLGDVPGAAGHASAGIASLCHSFHGPVIANEQLALEKVIKSIRVAPKDSIWSAEAKRKA